MAVQVVSKEPPLSLWFSITLWKGIFHEINVNHLKEKLIEQNEIEFYTYIYVFNDFSGYINEWFHEMPQGDKKGTPFYFYEM